MSKEIKQLEYFIPKNSVRKMITADKAFTQFSERGIKPDFSRIENPYRYFQLLEAKRWRGITSHEMWEQALLDGSICYWTLLGGENPNEILPREVVNFIKKELFKGADKETIENVYQRVLNHWTWYKKLLFKLNLC